MLLQSNAQQAFRAQTHRNRSSAQRYTRSSYLRTDLGQHIQNPVRFILQIVLDCGTMPRSGTRRVARSSVKDASKPVTYDNLQWYDDMERVGGFNSTDSVPVRYAFAPWKSIPEFLSSEAQRGRCTFRTPYRKHKEYADFQKPASDSVLLKEMHCCCYSDYKAGRADDQEDSEWLVPDSLAGLKGLRRSKQAGEHISAARCSVQVKDNDQGRPV